MCWWLLDIKKLVVHTSLKFKLNSLKISIQVSCVIFYQDCIYFLVCKTLPVRNRIKTHCSHWSCFRLNILLVLCGCHFYQAFRTAFFTDLLFSNISLFHLYDFWWDKLRPGRFSLSNREKKCLWCLLCRESSFMCKLSVGLYLLGLWRVHRQIKDSVGQGLVHAGFSSGHSDTVRIVVKDYQTGDNALSLFTCSLQS